MMHHEIMFCFLHQARPSSPNVTISCGLTSHIFQNLSESEGIIVQELSLPTKMVITAIELHHSSCTHIIMVEFQLGEAVACIRYQTVLFSAFRRVPNRALFCFCLCTKPCSFARFAVHQIVLFSAFRRAPNCALGFVVHHTVLFSAVARAPSRAFFCILHFKLQLWRYFPASLSCMFACSDHGLASKKS